MYSSILPVLALFLSLAHSAALRPRSNQGDATFYGGNLHGGACMFSAYTLPSGVFGTALSDSNWATAANCGACVEVTGPSGNLITAMIVDECPGCGLNHLDLFPDAFTELADPSKGVIPVTWSYVDCPISTPLQLVNKDGTSQYWFSMQVVNSAKAVSTLEVSIDGGATWAQTTRTDYNFFEKSSGFGTPNVDIRVTSIDGEVVIVNNVQVSGGASASGTSNFGPGIGSNPGITPPAHQSSPPKESSCSDTVVATSTTPAVPPPTTTPIPITASSSTTTSSANQLYTISSAVASSPALPSTPSSSPALTVTVYSYESCTI